MVGVGLPKVGIYTAHPLPPSKVSTDMAHSIYSLIARFLLLVARTFLSEYKPDILYILLSFMFLSQAATMPASLKIFPCRLFNSAVSLHLSTIASECIFPYINLVSENLLHCVLMC